MLPGLRGNAFAGGAVRVYLMLRRFFATDTTGDEEQSGFACVLLPVGNVPRLCCVGREGSETGG